jgi:hypothetical protein
MLLQLETQNHHWNQKVNDDSTSKEHLKQLLSYHAGFIDYILR